MMKLTDRYMDWCRSLSPDWVGYVMYIVVALAVIVTLMSLVAALAYLTKGWIVLSLPIFLLYTVYLALNQ
jgi:uncharacterized protein involved in cysteine biosynthesis